MLNFSNSIEYMKILFIKIIFALKIHHIFRLLIQKGKVSVLLFHECEVDVFIKSIKYFKKYYNIISLKDYVDDNYKDSYENNKPFLVITFDDGHKSNYKLLEAIKELQVPVTIFLVYEYLNTEKPFWFNIQDLSEEELSYIKTISNNKREQIIKKLNNKSKDRGSLNLREITQMNAYVDFQSHSLSHPILINCSDETSKKEIIFSKTKLESILNKNIDYFAYPNGDFTKREIKYLKSGNYKAAVTIKHGFNDLNLDNKFEIKRILVGDGDDYKVTVTCASGIYSSIKSIFGISPSINS